MTSRPVPAVILGALWVERVRRARRRMPSQLTFDGPRRRPTQRIDAQPCHYCGWPAAPSSSPGLCPACSADPRALSITKPGEGPSGPLRAALVEFLQRRALLSSQRSGRVLPRLYNASDHGEALIERARHSLSELRRELLADVEVEPTVVYDVGAELVGLCVECGAWPSERHMSPECPHDKWGFRQVFWGRWNGADRAEVAPLLAVRAVFSDLGEAAGDDKLTVMLLDARVAFHLGEAPLQKPTTSPESFRRRLGAQLVTEAPK